jgi:DNA-binding HxlR family transcriptional regulator
VVPFGEYCAFTKAVEHLGDRWSLLIVRDLALQGSLGFNAIADGLPGISRSVLARRLRKLEALGLIARDSSSQTSIPPYRLAPAGERLMPVVMSLRLWAERWVPEDPTFAEHDPDVIVWWLVQRIDPAATPEGKTVLALNVAGLRTQQSWLVLERGLSPSICEEDPRLPLERYLYVDADAAALLPLARGLSDWPGAIADGSVELAGEPEFMRTFPDWFRPPEPEAWLERT